MLHNKRAHTVLVRIPSWVEVGRLTCFVNGLAVNTALTGNTVVLKGLESGDTIRIQFPVSETTDQYTIGDTTYTVTFRGSMVVDVQPRQTDSEADRDKYPFFARAHLKATRAPLRKVRRFVTDNLIPKY